MCLEDTPHTVWWGRERVWVERVTVGSDQRWGCRGRWSPEITKPRLRVWDQAAKGECLVKKGHIWVFKNSEERFELGSGVGQ